MKAIQSDKIQASLYRIVNEHITQPELNEQLLKFVAYQAEKGFPFGELLVLHYNLFAGIETEEIYLVAAAIELLILSFDILDDLEDGDGQDKPWSSAAHLSLNSSTALLFLSVHIINSTSLKYKDSGISLLLKFGLQAVHGQHKDLLNTCRNEDDYIGMTIEKSGSLTSLACLVGTALAIDSYPIEVETYSKYIGVIGQMNNDLTDISNWNEKNDLLNKKFTLPIIYLLSYKDEQLQFIHEYYENKIAQSEMIKNQKLINQKLIETGAIAYTEVIKKLYQHKAWEGIQKIHHSKSGADFLSKYIY